MDGWAYQSTAFLATKAVPQAVLAWLQGASVSATRLPISFYLFPAELRSDGQLITFPCLPLIT